MTKRLIDIDDELLARARELADSETIKGTVDEALRALVRIESARRHIELLGEALEPDAAGLLDESRGFAEPAGGLPR